MSSPDTSSALHEQAMALTDEADALARRARLLFARAASKEARAAELAGDSEPSRSILYRSAAWLALSAGSPAWAVRLAHLGLGGHPVERLRHELQAVITEAERVLKASEALHGS